ncbi:MAG: CDP-diacylglycerol--serine O-phosphatidyltransferase [Gemmataceae bacterium]|nr:CDP-diacylglycerol--serine O-phosphatidyltransferase [Gemmataceae bacterium]MDW8264555.1 CDP-diacylglycerol--serine O-phosphatidyltransferase [Gemmataceae bacterium]
MNKIGIIPTLLTLGNAVCGFAAIAYASKIDGTPQTQHFFSLSGWLLIAAMVFDVLDGSVARLSKTASAFGGELDSLCDAVSFGAAPAFLLMRLGPDWDRPNLHRALAVVATLYLVCTLLRLARFNVQNTPDAASHKSFQGLPSPGAAGCIASLAVLRGELTNRWTELDPLLVQRVIEAWATLGAMLLALLMVSQVSYPHLTNQVLRGRRHFNHLVQLLVAAFVLILFQELALVVLFWGYALGVLGQYLWALRLHYRPLPAPSAGVDDRSLT